MALAMSRMIRDLNQIQNPFQRAGAWLLAGTLACLMGTMAWLTAMVFFVIGATAVHFLGLDVPNWVGWFALLGMPLGAWLEIRFAG